MNIRFLLIFFLVLTVLLLNFCSGRGDRWDVHTEPEPSAPDPAKQQEREEITVTSFTEKPEEIELKEVEEENPLSNDVFQTGIASWYGDGDDFHGKQTANGEIYDMDKLTAAHKTLSFHTLVEVENAENGKKVTVRINDRGPFIEGRIIDLSREAAKRIGIYGQGTAPVRLRVVRIPGSGKTARADTTDTSTPVTVTMQPVSQGTCYLQAGAFGAMKNAKRLLRNIKRISPGVPFKIEYKDNLYKVLSDGLTSREEAEKLKDRLEQSGIDSFIREE